MKRFGMLSTALLALAAVHSGQCSARAQEKFLPDDAKFVASTVQVPMRDGKTLAADIIVPKQAGKHPVILIQTPYNKNNLRAAFTGTGRYGPDSLFTNTNYAFVVTDWRGKFASKDAGKEVATPDLGKDGFDTCAWIAKQEWCNGKIGTWGPSALGRAQYETARANPPNLVCSVPMVMSLGLPYETMYPGGALWEEFVFTLGKIGFGTTLYEKYTAHPSKDATWRLIASTFVKGEDIRVPMLFIGGWYDIYPDGVPEAFEAVRTRGGARARAHSKLIMGPWAHTTDSKKVGALEFAKAENYGIKHAQAFFDHWLREAKNDFDVKQPPITYYQMGAEEWRASNTWPPAGSKERQYYLHPNHVLMPAPVSGDGKPATFKFDPTNPAPTIGGHVLSPGLAPGPQDQRAKVENRADVLIFQTPVLQSDLAVAGKIRLKLHVSSDRTDTDFTAIVTDVYPDGRSLLVSEGIQRMRFRAGPAREELMKPGEVYPITIELTNTALTFLKGHRLRLLISSSNHPRYAVNLNDGGPMYKKGQGVVATNSVHADAKHPSALALPVCEQ